MSIIYQEDGPQGKFSKSYTIIEGKTQQQGKGTPMKQASAVRMSDDPDDLNQCLHQLDVVARTKDARRRKKLFLEVAHDDKIHQTIRCLAQNTINRRIPLEVHHKKKLLKHSQIIQQLARKNLSKSKSKQLIEQSGGFLPILFCNS